MKVKVRVLDPVQKKDGTWDLIEYEQVEEYPDDHGFHSLLCVNCGLSSAYPECREWCESDKFKPKTNRE